MCGFYCIISSDQINLESSKKSLDMIKHRGPDSQKYFLGKDNRVFFGFNRLSVIDLSDKADQPMQDRKSKRIIVNPNNIYGKK